MDTQPAEKVYQIQEIRERISPVAQKYSLPAVYLFGSYARGEATPSSDVDLLIDRGNSKVRGMFEMGALYEELCHALEKEIDLVTMQTLEQRSTKERNASFVDALKKERIRLI